MSVLKPTEVALELAAQLRQVPGIANAYDAEPEILGVMPCATLVFSNIEPREIETGPSLDVTWRWMLRLYTNLSDLVAAQRQLQEITWECLRIWAVDPTLGRRIEWWTVADSGEQPSYDARLKWLRKQLVVEARLRRVGA